MARKSYTEIESEFENMVLNFLQSMDFNDIKNLSDFKIGGKQIDIGFGTQSKTYVVVSCIARTQSRIEGYIESKINELKDSYVSILDDLKSIDSLKEYKDLKLVIAINGANTADRDLAISRKDPIVYVWNDQFFEYYNSLHTKIGVYSKYELQRELDITLNESEFSNLKNIPSLKINNDNGEFYYLTAMDPIDLLKITYVARRERGDQSFYQRMINENKLKKIAYQISKNKLSFWNNLILSALDDDGIEFEEVNRTDNISFGKLTFNNALKSLWIVDGQHRLYGYGQVKEYSKLNHPKIPLSLIVNKNEREQGSIFMSINTNQTILSEDYKWDLYGVYRSDFKRNISALTPKYLNDLPSIKGRVYIPSITPTRKKGLIGISKIGRTIYEQTKLFYGNLDSNKPNWVIKQKDDELKNSKRLADVLDDNLTLVGNNDLWLLRFFTTSTGIQIYIILMSNYLIYYSSGTSDVGEYLKLLCESTKATGKFNSKDKIRKFEQSLNSREEKNMFIEELITLMNDRITTLGKQINLIPIKSRKTNTHEQERMIRDFVKKTLKSASEKWFDECVPDDVKSGLKTRHKGDSEELWEYIDIGSLIKILESTHNWEKIFKQIFLYNENSIFSDKDDVIYTFKSFKKLRDAESHARTIDVSNKEMGNVAAKKIRRFIERVNDEAKENI
jgi:DGQHR domain-containing protein